MPVYNKNNPLHADMEPSCERYDNEHVDGMLRNQLIKSAKVRYPNISGKAWFKAPNQEIKNALKSVSGYVPDKVLDTHNEWKSGSKPKPKPKPKPVPAVPVPAVPPEAQALLDLLASLKGSGGTSEERVREIVQEALAGQVPVPVTITEPKTGATKTIRGQHHTFPKVLQAVSSRKNVMLYGPPGTGKSYAAKAVADTLDMHYAEISCSPTLTKFDLIGSHDVNGDYVGTPFRHVWERGGVFLVDEADNSNGQETAVLNNGMANGRMAFPDGVVDKHKDCVIVMAANTVGLGATREYTGRQALDGPLRDRLLYIHWAIDEALEAQIVGALAKAHDVEDQARSWHGHVIRLRRAVEKSGQVRVVVSPRASIEAIPMLAHKWTHDELEDALVWKGADKEVRTKVRKEL